MLYLKYLVAFRTEWNFALIGNEINSIPIKNTPNEISREEARQEVRDLPSVRVLSNIRRYIVWWLSSREHSIK